MLTPRETEILAMIAVGATDEQISDKLRISPHMIKDEISKIFRKIGATDRLEAILWATKNL